MTDEQITRIIKVTPPANPLYVAFMQLLEEARDEAIESEARDAPSPTAMAMHSGGARYLKAVRNDIIRRRHAKLKGKRPEIAHATIGED